MTHDTPDPSLLALQQQITQMQLQMTEVQAGIEAMTELRADIKALTDMLGPLPQRMETIVGGLGRVGAVARSVRRSP